MGELISINSTRIEGQLGSVELDHQHGLDPSSGSGMWGLMKGDQIPLSLESVSISILIMVIGLMVNLGVVIFFIRLLVYFNKRTKAAKSSKAKSWSTFLHKPVQSVESVASTSSTKQMIEEHNLDPDFEKAFTVIQMKE